MKIFSQIVSITAMGLSTIPQRLGSSLVVVVGMTCVVGVVISVLSMYIGFRDTMMNTGQPDRALVFSRGATYQPLSSLARDNAVTISDAPGVAKGVDGKPLAMTELLTFVMLKRLSNGISTFVSVYGVGQAGLAVRPEVRMIAGRMFQPGLHEVIVGKLAQQQFEGLHIDDQVGLQDGDWTVVGTFEGGDSVLESDLVADVDTLLAAFRRPTFSSVTVKLESADAFDRFKAALMTDPTLAVDVSRETDYQAFQSRQLNTFLISIAVVLGILMGTGALFGALNAMYSAISARMTEIATLRAIGFGNGVVVASVFIEALLLAVIGGSIGSLLAWLAFNGNIHGFGGFVFHLRVTPLLMVEGVALAVFIGLLGGFFPAIQMARVTVATALQRR